MEVFQRGGKVITKDLEKSWVVLLKLMKGLFSRVKTYVENWYTRGNLFKYLKENVTAAHGTAKANK